MSEPGAVSGAVVQNNNQGSYSRNQYSSFIPSGGDAPNPINAPNNTTGFNNNGAQDSNDSTGKVDGQHDEVRGGDTTESSKNIEIANPSDSKVAESPFVHYVKRLFSNKESFKDQEHYTSRSLGRGMNNENIRNAVYWGESEADIFDFGMNTSGEITKEDIVDMNDIKHRDI